MDSEVIRRAFGEAVRHFREQKGFSQKEFAAAVGISRQHLIRLEHGLVNPTLEMGFRLLQALGASFAEVGAHIDRALAGGKNQYRMLSGGIMLAVQSGRMNLAANREFVMNVYTTAKRLGALKVLLDLSGMIYDFTQEEEYEGAMEGLKIFEELKYKPEAIAVVATFSPFGAKVAQDHAVNVRLFSNQHDAKAWLREI